jgi:hypothetical protein
MRFSYNDADNYGSNGSSSFFQLKNDKDTARVRIMYRGMDDVEGLAVHEIELDGKKRYVNCVREYNDPIDKCPLCKANYKVIAKLFVPLFNEETGDVMVWERGKKFFGKLSSLCGRYDNLVSHIFEIERNGKPKDTATTYEIYPISEDNTTLDDLPEPVDVMKGIVLDKSADDMAYFVKYHEFPDSSDDKPPFDEEPRRRESAPARRTPARGDAF